AWAERLARALAPLRDATPDGDDGGLPSAARLLDLLPVDAVDATALAGAWQRAPRSTGALLGVAADGPLTVDLRADGPHALVAGTTGAGKSELLQTLVASLAVANRPDEMSFVLVDYKGGSAFKDCALLPHTVGMVTDLDGQLTERALASLGAELRRREHVLKEAGCKDIDDLLARHGSGPSPMPRLVLVIDEFATLVEELPDFVGGLVGIAQRGRSLGVHLVLATQRPGGVVSADIRANTALRIALRVADPAESCDVIDVRDAALIPRSVPGRAFVRTGTGVAVGFQAARVGGHARARTVRPTVRPLPWPRCWDPLPPPVGDVPADSASDLSRIVGAARTAAEHLGVRKVASPWLAPLPAVVTLSEMHLPDRAARTDATSSPWRIPIAVCDVPEEQRRRVVHLDLVDGDHVLVAGGARSGRTTALRVVAAGIGTRPVTDVHLYAVDAGAGGLAGLAALPHCGAVVGRDEVARGDRLLTRLLEEVARRQRLLSAGGFASVAEQRRSAATEQALPYLVLLLDSWEGFVAAFDAVDHGRPVDDLLRLLREGPSVGLRGVVTGERSALAGRLASSVGARLLLRMPDPTDYAMAGVPLRMVPSHLPPGRGLWVEGNAVHEAHVPLLDADPSGAAQSAALAAVAARARSTVSDGAAGPQPLRVDALPTVVSSSEVAREAASCASGPLWALVGVGGDELAPVGVDLEQDGPGFVVAGPPGSGRSTALLTMAGWLAACGSAVAVVASGRSPLRTLSGGDGVLGVLTPRDAGRLAEILTAPQPLTVVVDDVEDVADSPVEPVLAGLLRPGGDAPRALLLAGDSTGMAGAYRGLAVEARRSRCGLHLRPGGLADGDLFGIRLARSEDPRPGRGMLVLRGRVTPVQVALADLPAGSQSSVA
ncbi:MAG: FtsK/SpoIIIE domain-containing protein, partial [Actinomycetota bacterium]|nr:FtsK/SpoIIIE domain-containing protein [Actinomycetota bacterium]